MPEWKPYTKEEPCEMIFTSDGPVVSYKKETPYKAFLIEKVKERSTTVNILGNIFAYSAYLSRI